MSAIHFPTLCHGSAADVAELLDGGDHTPAATTAELQAAMVNAFTCIARLEKQVAAWPPLLDYVKRMADNFHDPEAIELVREVQS